MALQIKRFYKYGTFTPPGGVTSVKVNAVTKANPIRLGGGSMFAVLPSGQVYAWGLNSSGQLGIGNTTTKSSPTLVVGGLSFATISCSGSNTIGLLENGTAYAWGSNTKGAVGDGTTTHRSSPVLVAGGLFFKKVVAGSDSMAGITHSGHVYCWGNNSVGQLGDGTTVAKSSPVMISTLTDGVITDLVAGNYAGDSYYVALEYGGQVWSWGASYGIGDGSGSNSSTPVAVLYYDGEGTNSIGAMLKIATCGGWSVALDSDGNVWQWGVVQNLGKSNYDYANYANLTVVPSNTFEELGVSEANAWFLKSDGTLYMAGLNANGQIGDGSTTTRTSPVAVAGNLKFKTISLNNTNGYSVLGLTRENGGSGTLYAWGYGSNGEIGNGASAAKSSPTIVSGGITAVAIASSSGYRNGSGTYGLSDYNFAVDIYGVPYSWGYNGNGELGDASVTKRSSPVVMSGYFGYQRLSVVDTVKSFDFSVTPGTSYSVDPNGRCTWFGSSILGNLPADYIEIIYEQ
jgi:alpha-tubulin suppressor-like RCC1 family protein